MAHNSSLIRKPVVVRLLAVRLRVRALHSCSFIPALYRVIRIGS
jgi:hypothetical protein